MVSPVYSVIIIIVGVLMLVGVAGLFLVCGLLAWQTWALVKVNRVVGEALAALVEPMKQAGTKIDAVGVVVTDLKGFQEGDMKLIDRLIKAVTGLDRTVEELQACLIAPPAVDLPPRARRVRTTEVQVASEADELVREQQRKERGDMEVPDMAQFGKNVATA